METNSKIATIINSISCHEKYDWEHMFPKVTYDDWIVCFCTTDSKLYQIDFDDLAVNEVNAFELFKYNENFEAIDANGNPICEDALIDYHPCFCCGESDDMSCYIYFETIK
jgi:hypothetical protein